MLSIVLGSVAFVLWIALSAVYKKQTGVAPPSRQAHARIHRRARKRGTSVKAEHDAWLNRKRKAKGLSPMPPD